MASTNSTIMLWKHLTGTQIKSELKLKTEILLQPDLRQMNIKRRAIIEVHRNRLNRNFAVVAGRKLSQQTAKSRKCGAVVARGKFVERKISLHNLNLLKSFKFNFSKKSSNIDDLLCPQSEIDLEIDRLTQTFKQMQINAVPERINELSDNYIYFVLDTNVLMDSLHMLEAVSRLTLNGTSGSRLYVPYTVIKQLDTLKGKKETSFAACRAKEYLDQKHIERQTALDDVQHLIDIYSPDDSIINCCLQLKSNRKSVMLLTNHNNMRLKAFASSIQVSNCYQLVSCKSHSWSPRLKRYHMKRVRKSYHMG